MTVCTSLKRVIMSKGEGTDRGVLRALLQEAAHHFVAVIYGKDELLEVPPGVRLWKPPRPGN